jgi:hypothetical protein
MTETLSWMLKDGRLEGDLTEDSDKVDKVGSGQNENRLIDVDSSAMLTSRFKGRKRERWQKSFNIMT